MKVLCPIEFSDSCVHAVEYAIRFVEKMGGGHIELLHCTNIRKRSLLFVDVQSIFIRQAEDDMAVLVRKLKYNPSLVNFTTKVTELDPKRYIAQYATQHAFDYVIVGTKGMTAMKDYIIGSVTEVLFNTCKVPVIAIPPGYESDDEMHQIVFAVDRPDLLIESVLRPVCAIAKVYNAPLHLLHISDDVQENISVSSLPCMEAIEFKLVNVLSDASVVDAIGSYCQNIHADLLAMVHRRRGWFGSFLHKSKTKAKLYQLERPVMVINE